MSRAQQRERRVGEPLGGDDEQFVERRDRGRLGHGAERLDRPRQVLDGRPVVVVRRGLAVAVAALLVRLHDHRVLHGDRTAGDRERMPQRQPEALDGEIDHGVRLRAASAMTASTRSPLP